ncbi:YkvA family protein [Brevibacillus sp. SYSU BS000544]|uniref:YkvA family protein n=1 Tax=Brevibacillus sp. SYSU BS000544 TaxID=3416443 RepID=UPI003CE47121
MSNLIQKSKEKAKQIKRELFVLLLAYKHPRVPLYAKIFTLLVVAYACSPIDLIPDFIPVLGLLDDIILVPLGIYFAIRMIPADVLAECRAQAMENSQNKKPRNWFAGAIIVLIWLVVLGWVITLLV